MLPTSRKYGQGTMSAIRDFSTVYAAEVASGSCGRGMQIEIPTSLLLTLAAPEQLSPHE